MFLAQSSHGSNQANWPRLLADIGGTYARLALLEEADAELTALNVLRCADYAGPLELITAYLSQTAQSHPKSASLAMANPVSGDQVQMTNLDWTFSIESLRAALGLNRLLVLNDFSALALAIPSILPADLHPLTAPDKAHHHGFSDQAAVEKPDFRGPIALIGPGTGLGVSGLIPAPGAGAQWLPLMGEGGHVTLFAESDLEFSILQWFRARYGHVSAERILSGTGLVELVMALNALQGQPNLELSPAQVLSMGLSGEQANARQALDLFCGWLGAVAGNLALTLGASGGVYIGGGIAPRISDFLSHSSFRSRFVAKGRFQSYLEAIPTWLIMAQVSPALYGASSALESHTLP